MNEASEIPSPEAPEPPPPEAPDLAWSEQQLMVFEAIEDLTPGHHLIVQALAGTGKTTTIVEAINYTQPEDRVLVLAFNKAIAGALKERCPDDVTVLTSHSFGLRHIPGRRKIDGRATSQRVRALVPHQSASVFRHAVCQVISQIKGQFTDLPDPGTILRMVQPHFEVKSDLTFAAQTIQTVLTATLESTTDPIDFDDMLWLPIALNVRLTPYDWVFVDEAQDLNPVQIEMVKRIAGSEGRVVAVGDPHQAVYAFRGADAAAMHRLQEGLNANVLPLSVTYRCPRRVVQAAQKLVPSYTAADIVPQGEVRWVPQEVLNAQADEGDFVISRLNAPLMGLALRWLRAERPCTILGKDLEGGLTKWVKDHAKRAPSIKAIRDLIPQWEEKETLRLQALDHDTSSVAEKAACLRVIAQAAGSPEHMLTLLSELFKDRSRAIILMSAHRSKGLEAPTVWVMADTFGAGRRSCYWCRGTGVSARDPEKPCFKCEGRGRFTREDDLAGHNQEANLLYVALTRSQQRLMIVSKEA